MSEELAAIPPQNASGADGDSDATPPAASDDAASPPAPLAMAILTPGDFTQLITVAQQSGLVSNADAIITVRDREFRFHKYQRAFDVIEGLHQQLSAQATRRQGELRRQEVQYKSGVLKMTPREWMDRQRRETEKTQKIDRARRQFARVLDGLSILRAEASE
jgi:hypothetical protein